MSDIKLVDHKNDNEKTFDSRSEAESQKVDLENSSLGYEPGDLEVKQTGSNAGQTEVVEPDTVDAEPIDTPEQLSQNPIGFLESVNTDFVNTIKGTPAISKQGFRFIQREFGITTEAEVVKVLDDPVGVIVWAKAELPDGYSAEAHGEGYLNERDVSDNEFVRYADTRAKNRALSDLTSAGALAVSELSGDSE